MPVLAQRDSGEDDISPFADPAPRPKQNTGDTLPLHVASKGIGAAGSIPIRADVWNKHLPRDMKRALIVAPDLGDLHHQASAVLAKAMHRDGLLKGALIADMRFLNAMTGPPPRPFELPSMAQLAVLLELPRSQNVQAYLTKLDASNMLWSVLLPPEYSTSFRFRVKGITYTIPPLQLDC